MLRIIPYALGNSCAETVDFREKTNHFWQNHSKTAERATQDHPAAAVTINEIKTRILPQNLRFFDALALFFVREKVDIDCFRL